MCLYKFHISSHFSHILQVEPSPTTGSLPRLQQTSHSFMTSFMSATFPVTTVCYNTNPVDDGKSSFFEFKPHNRSNMVINYLIFSLHLIFSYFCRNNFGCHVHCSYTVLNITTGCTVLTQCSSLG